MTLSRNRNSLEFDAMPLPALHAANVDRMRQRFEEAKQRMNLMHQRALDSGLIARGGGAGGSNPGFSSLRSSFEDSRDQVRIMVGRSSFPQSRNGMPHIGGINRAILS